MTTLVRFNQDSDRRRLKAQWIDEQNLAPPVATWPQWLINIALSDGETFFSNNERFRAMKSLAGSGIDPEVAAQWLRVRAAGIGPDGQWILNKWSPYTPRGKKILTHLLQMEKQARTGEKSFWGGPYYDFINKVFY